MKFIKELCLSTILYAVAALLSVVAFILLLVSHSVQGNAIDGIGLGIAFGIIGMLASFASVFVSIRYPREIWAPIVHLVAIACFGVLFGFILLNRVELAAAVFSYDSNNALGWTAFTTGVVSIILYVLSSLLITVGMFFLQYKPATVAELNQES